MRIGLVLPGFSSSEEDWCIPVLLHLVRELSQIHELEIYPLRYPHSTDPYRVFGAHVQPFGAGQVRGIRQIPLLMRVLARLVRDARRNPFSLLHGFFALDSGALTVAAARLLGVPSLVTLMGGELASLPEIGYGGMLKPRRRVLTRAAMTRPTRLIAVSKVLEQQAQAYPTSSPVKYLPWGVDEQLFQPGGQIDQRVARAGWPQLLNVGSLVPVKGQNDLLEAFRTILSVHTEAHLHVVGEGPQLERLGFRCRSLGLASQVTFHGLIEHHELPGFFRAADLFLLSSLHEGFSMAALEAAACATPIVGTSVGVLPEMEPVVRTVPVGDPDALATEALQLLADRERLKKRGAKCRELVLQRFRIRNMVQELDGLYRSLVADKHEV